MGFGTIEYPFIVQENGFKVRRLGRDYPDGPFFYQMECDDCPAPSGRSSDWQELRGWGHVHRARHHKVAPR